MKKQTTPQSIYKRFKRFIILGTVAILTITTTATKLFHGKHSGVTVAILIVTTTATAPNFETTKQQAEQGYAPAQYELGTMYYLG